MIMLHANNGWAMEDFVWVVIGGSSALILLILKTLADLVKKENVNDER